MSSFYVSNKKDEHINDANLLFNKLNSEYNLEYKNEELHLLYHVIPLNGETEFRYWANDIVVLYDGVIYNGEGSSISDTSEFLIKMYTQYGPVFTQKLDGEYSICLFDFKNHLCVFSSDVFGTRPLWYCIQDDFIAISSYSSILSRTGCSEIVRLAPNTTYTYHLKTKILSQSTIYHFNLIQYKCSYNDWITAFERAIYKRMEHQKSVVALSSGYDSGAIYCEAIKGRYDFSAFSFIGRENKKILLERVKLHDDVTLGEFSNQEYYRVLKEVLKYCETYEKENYNILQDESSIGLGMTCKYAKKIGCNVVISGSCADAVFSYLNSKNYALEDSPTKYSDLFPPDLSKIFPWENLFTGSRELYITQEQYISDIYGIQTRYPFLDKDVVQEFLWLEQSLKNNYYKAPIHEYFTENKFPFEKEKIGFYIK